MASCMRDVDVFVGSQSGLTQAVRDSKISLQQAEYEFLSFIRQHTQPGQCPLAGEWCKHTTLPPFCSWTDLDVNMQYLSPPPPPQVTLCTPTRSSWTSTCPSSCTISTTGSSTSVPSRSFAGDLFFLFSFLTLFMFVSVCCCLFA